MGRTRVRHLLVVVAFAGLWLGVVGMARRSRAYRVRADREAETALALEAEAADLRSAASTFREIGGGTIPSGPDAYAAIADQASREADAREALARDAAARRDRLDRAARRPWESATTGSDGAR